jgi:hypothetical protein
VEIKVLAWNEDTVLYFVDYSTVCAVMVYCPVSRLILFIFDRYIIAHSGVEEARMVGGWWWSSKQD